MELAPKTVKDKDGKKYHVITGINVECSGQDCAFCKGDTDISFHDWENSVPFPMPSKGKRYKNPIVQKNRGKTVMEICYTCKKTPCYICRRTKCPKWMKEESRKGQEEGCSSWQKGRCTSFSCEFNLIRTNWWERNYDREKLRKRRKN